MFYGEGATLSVFSFEPRHEGDKGVCWVDDCGEDEYSRQSRQPLQTSLARSGMRGEFQRMAGWSTVSKGRVLAEEIGGIMEQGYMGHL